MPLKTIQYQYLYLSNFTANIICYFVYFGFQNLFVTLNVQHNRQVRAMSAL